jgi:hypothetical protein
MLREVPRMVKHHPHEQTMHLPVFLVGAHCQLRLFARRQSALIAHDALHKTGTAALLMLHRAYVPEQIRARFARIGRITGYIYDNWFTVVVVVKNIKHQRMNEPPEPLVYLSLFQAPHFETIVQVRTEGDPQLLAAPVEQAIHELNSKLPVSR